VRNLKYFLLSKLLGIDEYIIKKTKQRTSLLVVFSTLVVVSFPVILFLVFDYLFYDIAFAYLLLAAIFCSLPLYNIFTFYFISWRKSSLLSKYNNEFKKSRDYFLTGLIRAVFIGLVILFISSTTFTFFLDDSLSSEIEPFKTELINNFSNNASNKINLAKINFKKETNIIKKEIEESKKTLSEINENDNSYIYYSNRLLSLDSIKINNETKFNSLIDSLIFEKEKIVETYSTGVLNNPYFFKRMSIATSSNLFVLYLLLITTFFLIFSFVFYTTVVSEKSAYFNIDILVQKEILILQNNPIINHTSNFLKEKFNHDYKLMRNGLNIKFYENLDNGLNSKKIISSVLERNKLIDRLKNGL
jgi:hypothetical protein